MNSHVQPDWKPEVSGQSGGFAAPMPRDDFRQPSKNDETRIAMKKLLLLFMLICMPALAAEPVFSPDEAYLVDRANLDKLQRDCFGYMWADGDPPSGMAYEANFYWEDRPIAVGGTGFGIASLVVAADRGWITREQALDRLMKIVTFLRDRSPRKELHGAYPHWLIGRTGRSMGFDKGDAGADIVETSLLMQGLLIARAYFNGPGVEERLREIITELWEGVDWDWFTNGEEIGIYWHWDKEHGFTKSLRILGYNECFITYILAMGSPTHPVSRKNYDYWTSGKGYQPKDVFGYRLEAALAGGGPMFLSHYSFIGLDPRRMADDYVPSGYFIRNVKHTLSNRGYCLQNAPAKNRYSESCWGLTASQIKDGYAANEPLRDSGTIAPTAALSSIPYTPQYSFQVLDYLLGDFREKIWGPYGPFDAFAPRTGWISDRYLAIDQLPIVCMVENYRSGLLWRLLMSDKDVRAGLERAGIREPELKTGFPEAVVTVKLKGRNYVPDAYDIRRHPDTGLFAVPYWVEENGPVSFALFSPEGNILHRQDADAVKGRNSLSFPQFMAPDGNVLTLVMRTANGVGYRLPLRLH